VPHSNGRTKDVVVAARSRHLIDLPGGNLLRTQRVREDVNQDVFITRALSSQTEVRGWTRKSTDVVVARLADVHVAGVDELLCRRPSAVSVVPSLVLHGQSGHQQGNEDRKHQQCRLHDSQIQNAYENRRPCPERRISASFMDTIPLFSPQRLENALPRIGPLRSLLLMHWILQLCLLLCGIILLVYFVLQYSASKPVRVL